MSPHTKLLHGCLQGVDMERAMGAIKGQHRFTRMVQLAEIIFAVLFPDWTVVLVLLLTGGGSDPAVIPDSISPAAGPGHGFFAVPHSN